MMKILVVDYLAALARSLDNVQRRTPAGHVDSELARTRALVDHAARLNGHLLDLARGGARSPASLDLGALVSHTLYVFARLIPEAVALSVAVDVDLVPVRGVRCELEQLLLNLVINAVDAMPEGGSLRVAVASVGTSHVLLEVADSGAGADAGAPAARDGAGLGLRVVRAVADAHRATLRITERSGGGTRAVLLFPVAGC